MNTNPLEILFDDICSEVCDAEIAAAATANERVTETYRENGTYKGGPLVMVVHGLEGDLF